MKGEGALWLDHAGSGGHASSKSAAVQPSKAHTRWRHGFLERAVPARLGALNEQSKAKVGPAVLVAPGWAAASRRAATSRGGLSRQSAKKGIDAAGTEGWLQVLNAGSIWGSGFCGAPWPCNKWRGNVWM